MILVVHVLAALGSIAIALYLYLSPSKRKFQATYGLTGLMLASGFYLVFANHANLLHACVMGLICLGIIGALVVATHRKLASADLSE